MAVVVIVVVVVAVAAGSRLTAAPLGTSPADLRMVGTTTLSALLVAVELLLPASELLRVVAELVTAELATLPLIATAAMSAPARVASATYLRRRDLTRFPPPGDGRCDVSYYL